LRGEPVAAAEQERPDSDPGQGIAHDVLFA
jgi:hypothetical protein